MNLSTDSESSSDETDFFVSTDKIDLKSSLFNKSLTKTKNVESELSTDSEGEEEQTYTNIELLSQILKNLENVTEESSSDTTKPNIVSKTDRNDSVKNEPSYGLTDEINDLLLKGECSSISTNDFINLNEKDEETVFRNRETYNVPQEGVKITISDPNIISKARKNKRRDFQELLRNHVNQKLRVNQLLIHKVGLLCWLAHGFHLNNVGNDPEVLATALSLVSTDNYPKGRIDLKYLEKFTVWCQKNISFTNVETERNITTEALINAISKKKVESQKELVIIYVAILRAMGLNCRLVISLYPPLMKLKQNQLFMPKKKEPTETLSKQKKKTMDRTKNKDEVSKNLKRSKTCENKSNKDKIETKTVPENSSEAKMNANLKARIRAARILKGKEVAVQEKSTNLKVKKKSVDNEIDATSKRQLRSRTIAEPEKHTSNVKQSKTKKCIPQKNTDVNDPTYVMEVDNDESNNESDSDFQEDQKKKLKSFQKSSSRTAIERYKKKKKLLSSDSENDEIKSLKNCENYWAEVYIESEECWISVSVFRGKIHCSEEIYKKATSPVLYVIAWNSAGKLKDVTRRYCPCWLTVTRKQRVDEKWWTETLLPWKEKRDALSRAEDDMLFQRELEQPLPKTLAECKGHPLYVIKRHLLKFEELYPPDSVPLGYLPSGDAIYSRHCVHTLCSREKWIQKARVVKPEQQPYKIVSSRMKYDKFSGQCAKDQPLELFGKWQTTPYDPPVAKDGKVPRNEYGNVDLFTMAMLPKGTVHINLPGLSRIAKKLDIDISPAIVGFNFGCGRATPAMEGFVVCEEYEDLLREAWETEQIEARKRAQEKREKRIIGNWRKIIRGIIIKQRLAAKYDFVRDEEQEDINMPTKRKKPNKNSSKTLCH